jgi:copper chaperone CopZ
MLLWMVTIFTVGSLVYPNFLAYHASTTQTPVPARSIAPTTSIMVFSIDNMTCEECTLTIVKALKASPGVYDASVDFASKHSTVSFNANKISAQELRIVIEKTGFPVIDMLHSEPH